MPRHNELTFFEIAGDNHPPCSSFSAKIRNPQFEIRNILIDGACQICYLPINSCKCARESKTPETSIIEALIEDSYRDLCPRCGCCSTDWQECEWCGGTGYTSHDCGEDCCVCEYPEDNVPCDICKGTGGWLICSGGCDENGKHDTGSVRLESQECRG